MSLKSRPFDVLTKPLTDKAIQQYALAGKYGSVIQARAQRLEDAKKQRKAKATKRKVCHTMELKTLKALLDL